MNSLQKILWVATGWFFLGAGGFVAAQPLSAREELLALVPGDSGFCLVVQDFRSQVQKWQGSPWIKALRESPPGQALVNSPEIQHLVRLQEELKKRLGLDWPSLRDEILGDALVFAYRPPLPGNPDHEQGLVLLRARRADLLAQLVERLNEEQKKSGELKELTVLVHQGIQYQKRVDKRTTHFVLVDGKVLVLSGKEKLIQGVIDQKKGTRAEEKNPLLQQINKAGAERALATLWINPRAFEPELEHRAQKDASPEALMVRTFLAYWKPLDAMVISLAEGEDVEIKLAFQARTKELPASVRKVFTLPAQASELWSRFPTNAVVIGADRIDLGSVSESLGDFSTPENRKVVVDALQKTLGAALGLDLLKDVLPNLGPDWGFCLVAAEDPNQAPHFLTVLGVKTGNGEVAVDQALFKGVQFFVSLAVFDYNRKNPHPLRLKSLMQENVEVRYLAGDKVFPLGVQPAWALKDGYLVFASSPDAILRFRQQNPMPTAGAEVPILRISIAEMAKLLRQHKEKVVDHIAEKNQLPKVVAQDGFRTALAVLDLVDHITFLQSSGSGQVVWTMRVRGKTP